MRFVSQVGLLLRSGLPLAAGWLFDLGTEGCEIHPRVLRAGVQGGAPGLLFRRELRVEQLLVVFAGDVHVHAPSRVILACWAQDTMSGVGNWG